MDDEKYQIAKKKVEALRGFYSNLASYVIINIFLVILNFLISPDHLWFYWVTIGWGIGILFHAFSVFGKDNVFGPEWEAKKVKEYMEKDNQ